MASARIARELHDTLLQSFHGLLLRFQTASYLLPERPAEAKDKLDTRLNMRRRRSPKAGTRSRACGRRPSNATISRSLRTPGDELATTRAPPAAHIQCRSRGQTRDLHPIVRDEIYKIAAEALRNAFRHAHAGRVEVDIRYDDEQFRCACVTMAGDRSGGARKPGARGHYGLRGMPERAALIEETGGVERSRRRDGGGAAPSCQHRLRRPSAPGGHGCCLQDGAARRRGRVMSGDRHSDSHGGRPSSRARRDRRSRGGSAGYDGGRRGRQRSRSDPAARTVRT